jgi:hypothetical protein
MEPFLQVGFLGTMYRVGGTVLQAGFFETKAQYNCFVSKNKIISAC